MSTLIFAQAKSIRKKALGMKKIIRNTLENLDIPEEQIKVKVMEAYDREIEHECNEFIEICKIAKKLHELYKKEIGLDTYNWYHISIRPNDKKISFFDFYDNVRKLVERKCFKQFHLVFEQKGEVENDIGNGFHCHIVADMIQKSKGEVLRDIKSTFNKMIKDGQLAENCMQVDTTRNPDEIINKYLTNHESKDGHKEKTKETDKLWREKMNIESYYTEVPPQLSIKSVRQLETIEDKLEFLQPSRAS